MVSPDWEELFDDYAVPWLEEYDEENDDDFAKMETIAEGGGAAEGVLHDLAFSKIQKAADNLRKKGRNVPTFMQDPSKHGLVKRKDKYVDFAKEKLKPIVEVRKTIKQVAETIDSRINEGKSPDTKKNKYKAMLQRLTPTTEKGKRGRELELAKIFKGEGRFVEALVRRFRVAKDVGRTDVEREAEASLAEKEFKRFKEQSEIIRKFGVVEE